MNADQLPLPLEKQAEAARDEGMRRSEAHAARRWKENALEAVRLCARTLPTFTTDDVWAVLELSGRDVLESDRNPSAIGPVMANAARLGIIEKTGTVRPSIRPSQHRQEIRVWRARREEVAA